MCNPLIATQAAGAVTDLTGSVFGAKMDRRQLLADARFADINAETSLDNAREALRQGQFEEQRVRLQSAMLKSRQRAAMGANNVDLSDGGALRTQVSTDYIAEVDANTVRANAARAAAGYRTEATDYRNKARMARAERSAISPALAGVTSLLSSGLKYGAANYTSLSAANTKNSTPTGAMVTTGYGYPKPAGLR